MKTRGFFVGGRHIGHTGRVQCGVERRVKRMEEKERDRETMTCLIREMAERHCGQSFSFEGTFATAYGLHSNIAVIRP